MGKISKLAKLIFVPGSWINEVKNIKREEPPRTEAEKEQYVYSLASAGALEAARACVYLTPIMVYYFDK